MYGTGQEHHKLAAFSSNSYTPILKSGDPHDPSLGPLEYHTETLYRFEASHGYVSYANWGYGSPCLGLRCSLEIVKNLCAVIHNF